MSEMALIKCKECDGQLSSTKTDTCPNCGAKIKKNPGTGSQLFASLVVLVLLLWLGPKALVALSAPEKKDPTVLVQELEEYCAAGAKEAPATMGDKKDFYDSCVFSGKSSLRTRGLIQ